MNDLPEGCKPFDRTELQKCVECGQGMAHDNELIFYELTVGQCMVDYRAVQQIAGLEMMMGGNAALASVFAPTSSVAVRLPPTRVLICGQCMNDPEKWFHLLSLVEKANEMETTSEG